MTAAERRIPITLITGFLGSGKTTLLNRFLRLPDASGVLVIVNEFGAVGVDHDLIEFSRDSVVLLTNGCLCCQVRGELVDTLHDVAFRIGGVGSFSRVSRVMIETTGLADPTLVLQALLTDPVLNSAFRLGTVVTVVDAVNGDQSLDRYPEAERQAAIADRVVLSKTDMLSDGSSRNSRLVKRVKSLNPMAEIVIGDQVPELGRLLCDDLGTAGVAADEWNRRAVAAGNVGHMDDGRYHTHVMVRDAPMSEDGLSLLMRFLAENLGADLLRVKGLVHVAEAPNRPAVIQAAQNALHDIRWLETWPSDDRRTRLIFITTTHSSSTVEEIIAYADRMSRGFK